MDSMFVKVLLRIVQENALVLGGAGAAIVLLLIGVFVFRKIKKSRVENDLPATGADAISRPFDEDMRNDLAALGEKVDMPAMGANGGDVVIIDDDIDAPLPDTGADKGDDIAAFEIKAGHDAAEDLAALDDKEDALMSSMMPDFDNEAHGQFDDMDEISIPRLGDAPEPKKHGFFSTAWLHRNRGNDANKAKIDPHEQVMTPQPADAKADKQAAAATADTVKEMEEAAHMAHLADIERKMLALRELYEAGLIAPEIYVLKAREFAQTV